MIIESVNIGDAKTINWRGKNLKTGIFKTSHNGPISLGFEDVVNDSVVDRKYHGGIDKACYSYSADAYQFWQSKYPENNFEFGFFGENLTINGLNESEIRIGNQYKVGKAIVEVSQPREPCFKLGIRFGSQKILKPFIACDFPGIYFRVLQPGKVAKGDSLELLHEDMEELTVLNIYKLIYGFEENLETYNRAIRSNKLATSARKTIKLKLEKKLSS